MMRFELMMTLCPVMVVALMCTTCQSDEHQKRLLDNLFVKSGYSPDVIPHSKRGNLTVNFSFGLHQVLSLKINSGLLISRTLTRTCWKDSQLTWNPEDYGGIDRIFLHPSKVFSPQVELYNVIESKTNNDLKVTIYYNGNVVWVRPQTYTTMCTHQFRGDSWNCPFIFRSWIYHSELVDLTPHLGFRDIDMTEYQQSAFWSVLSSTGVREERTYMWNDDKFPTMEYMLKVRNKIGHIMGKRSVQQPQGREEIHFDDELPLDI